LRRKQKLGRADEIPLAGALAEAERLRLLIRQGADPASEKLANSAAITFEELVKERLRDGDPLRSKTLRDYRQLLRKNVLPFLGNLPAKAITRNNIIDVLDRITQRGATRCADLTRTVISSVFAFGIDRALVSDNPASGLRNRHDYRPRNVVATADDIRRLWSGMDDPKAAISPTAGIILKLALLTGSRRTELAATRKSELVLNSALPYLTIPRGRAKNRNALRLPLSPQAAALFRRALTTVGTGEFVFPGNKDGSHIAGNTVTKVMARARAKFLIKDVTVHDLRRSVGTFLSQLGVPKDVRGRILNHGGKLKGSITDGIYNLYEYDPEKRAALELWADALDCIVKGKQAHIEDYHAHLVKLHGTGTVLVG
jgi:integrase